MISAKHILSVGILMFLAANIFGLTSMGSTMGTDGHMSGCPFMGVPAICHMSPLEHAFTLQSMLTATPVGMFAFLLALLAILTIATLTPLLWNMVKDLTEPLLRPPSRIVRFISRHSLQEAFARGILNSKAF